MISRWMRWFGYLLLLAQIVLGLRDNGLLRPMKEVLRLAIIEHQDFSGPGTMIPK